MFLITCEHVRFENPRVAFSSSDDVGGYMIGSALQTGYEVKCHILDIAPSSTREFPGAKLLGRPPVAR